MNWVVVVAIIWLSVAAWLYLENANIIDEAIAEDPDAPRVVRDIAAILVFLLWPLTIPTTIRKVKEKMKDRR